VIEKNLRVMDHTAITLCKENQLPIIVFNINRQDNLKKIIAGEKIGTLVTFDN
jgi:uridylate kinase